MTTNADTLFSAVRKKTSSLVMAFALLAVCAPSWAAEENGRQDGPAPGGLEIPPLAGGQEQTPARTSAQTPQQATGQEQTARPPQKDAPREDIISGTGQTFGGYSGTWQDPTRDETVTTVIAPRQPMMQQPPVYIAPQVYPNWDGSWSQGGGQYYPSQGYPGNSPYWNQGRRPHRPPHWNQGQRPQRPPYWNPGQRPPYWGQGQRPPSWNQGQRPPYWDQGQRPPSSWNPGQRPPYWGQTQRPPSSWNPGQRPPQGGGIPPSWWRGSGR